MIVDISCATILYSPLVRRQSATNHRTRQADRQHSDPEKKWKEEISNNDNDNDADNDDDTEDSIILLNHY